MANPPSSPQAGPEGADELNSTPSAPAASQASRLSNSRAPGSATPMFFSSPRANGSARHSNAATPRVSRLAMGASSPFDYRSSSSPTRARNAQRSDALQDLSSSAGAFHSSQPGRVRARDRRGDISADPRRTLLIDENGMPVAPSSSNANTFSTIHPGTSEADALGGSDSKVIWGSNISQGEVMKTIKDFLKTFEPRYRLMADGVIDRNDTLAPDHPARRKIYVDQMNTLIDLNASALNLDMKDLKSYPSTMKLWYQMQDFPNEIIDLFDVVIKECVFEYAEERDKAERAAEGQQPARADRSSSVPYAPSSEAGGDRGSNNPASQVQTEMTKFLLEIESKAYRVRPFNLDSTVNLRDLNPKDIDTVVAIKGLVIRTTPVIPDMKSAFFQCSVCNHTQVADIYRGKISEPKECPREVCKSKDSMQIVHNRSEFADKQVIKLQETPDNVPDGQTPHSVSVCAFNELVDFCRAGDRVEITGIFKCNQVRINPRQRTVKSVYKTYVDALHIQKIDKRRVGTDASTVEHEISEQVTAGTQEVRNVTEAEERKIKETAQRADIYELLARSLAPSVYEMDDVKKGILLQMFGGTNKSFEKGGNPKYRGDINVLLCGDPSTAKSQLLQYVHKIAPRGVYTSGKGSSAVGLTAYVTRDPETRQLVLESGALVLSDGGVCCIDEFDKMSESTRSVLHEVMEQQTVSIAKAGIITTLNARTSILASANPIGSKYNVNLPVPQNIDLPPTLLSRFDLVYLVLDRIDETMDRRLARHLVGMYLEDAPENAASREVLPVEFLTAYISYAREHCQPRLGEAASKELVQAYVEMRKLGEDVRAAERRITATTRQLESMIRLAEAHAKMRLAEDVTAADVREAVRLIKSAIKQAATDVRTGLIDMGLLTEGTSASERRRRADLKTAVMQLLDEMSRAGGQVRYAELAKQMNEQSSISVEGDEVGEALRSLQQEGRVQVVGEGARRTVRKTTAETG